MKTLLMKVNYQKDNDPYKDSGVSDITIVGVNNNFINHPRFKFLVLVHCISGNSNRIGVPKSSDIMDMKIHL